MNYLNILRDDCFYNKNVDIKFSARAKNKNTTLPENSLKIELKNRRNSAKSMPL